MNKKTIRDIVRAAYKSIPLKPEKKGKLKDFIYSNTSFITKNTEMYKAWEVSKHISNNIIEEQTNINVEDIKLNLAERYVKDILKTPMIGKNINEEYQEQFLDNEEIDTKLIAFYLPQFHPFPENDTWWGKGFTEWTNVSKAVPQFLGHYQPHLPGELGFYDLRLIENIKRQVELARNYGLHGFCFHYYWFSGERLLEKPLDLFVENKDIDFPFCLCWANENWTRRWDGAENDILMEQKYLPEDHIQFIKDLSKYIKDERYIKINGKPLIIVYRPAIIPKFKEMVDVWRKYCRENNIGEICVLGVKAWETQEPQKFGLDGLLEFPPHSMSEYGCELINDKLDIINPEFNGLVYDYEKFVEEEKYLFTPKYKLYKTVSPSWDNTARKLDNGTIFHKACPDVYKKWLKNVIRYTQENFDDDKVVFINAWNEWAEGAHLEPDRKYGYDYLKATKSALLETRSLEKKNLENKRIIYVSHDAHFHGAQLLSLNIVKQLKEIFNYDVYVILKSGGVLEKDFKNYSKKVYNMESENINESNLMKILDEINTDKAILNTVISGDLVKKFKERNIYCISLIHELPGVIKQYNAEKKLEYINKYADKIIFPSSYVMDQVSDIIKLNKEKIIIKPQGLYKKNTFSNNKDKAYKEVRNELNIPGNSKIILGVGYADYRKGIDIFSKVAKKVCDKDKDAYFVWIGAREQKIMSEVNQHIKENEILKKRLIFIEPQKDISRFYSASNAFLLTSREDPFPSVVLDSMNVSVPVVAFKGAGGFVDIINDNTGVLVNFENIEQMSSAVYSLINDKQKNEQLGKNAKNIIDTELDFKDYIYFLVELMGYKYKKVSVVIPNYNYEKYLPKRIESIIEQKYPVYEVIFLDDKSTDNSIDVAKKFEERYPLRFNIYTNKVNSKSVFKQWNKGIGLSKGDYIWIAEADDLSEKNFLQETMKGFYKDEEVILSYCESKQIDQYNNIIADNYLEYVFDVDKKKWNKDYINDGLDEIKTVLSIKNTIPNVSAAILNKKRIKNIDEILKNASNFRVAGDWSFYIQVLNQDKIAFSHKNLNLHRRHTNSVTKSLNNQIHFDEIVKLQNYVIDNYQLEKSTKDKIYNYRGKVRKYLLEE